MQITYFIYISIDATGHHTTWEQHAQLERNENDWTQQSVSLYETGIFTTYIQPALDSHIWVDEVNYHGQ